MFVRANVYLVSRKIVPFPIFRFHDYHSDEDSLNSQTITCKVCLSTQFRVLFRIKFASKSGNRYVLLCATLRTNWNKMRLIFFSRFGTNKASNSKIKKSCNENSCRSHFGICVFFPFLSMTDLFIALDGQFVLLLEVNIRLRHQVGIAMISLTIRSIHFLYVIYAWMQ